VGVSLASTSSIVSGSWPLICTRALLAIQLLAALVGSGLVVATVRSWIATGKITAHRVGPRLIRVDLDEIEAKIIHTCADGKRSVMINEDVVELDHKPEQHESAQPGVDLARHRWRGRSRARG
jgi:hypothetical protein